MNPESCSGAGASDGYYGGDCSLSTARSSGMGGGAGETRVLFLWSLLSQREDIWFSMIGSKSALKKVCLLVLSYSKY